MVSPSRSTTPRRRRDDAGKLFIGALLLLGLTASVFLVFSDNVQFVRIGLVAALWAAVIGALAATRYRKDAAVDKAKVRDLQTVYELQLEREINARREYEMGVEARVRAEVGADASEIAALRAELTLLRQNLQVLFEGALPDDQPALQADAVRIDALPSGATAHADFDAFDEAEPEIDDSHEAAAAAWFGPWQQPPSALKPVFMQPVSANFADPYDDPVTAETSAVQLDEYAESQQSTPEPEPAKSSSTKTPPPRLSAPHTRKVDNDGRLLDPEPSAPTSSNDADPSATPAPTGTDPSATPAPTGYTTPEPPIEQPAAATTTESGFEAPPNSGPAPTGTDPSATPATTPTVGTSSRRRRRAESEGTRLSVADIMANLQSESTRT
ncbi:DUF6779 domain-containing protein [Nocardia rosealba]|uniref:DUF6779 domain-containing protein n=1 Tax=Nocardia rosealba TaxID=2878563 RepID=UPI001CDA4547|nr:DUF6779 domain-containing protein [Nocardia rosealba]MCA2209492.1 hypothetical protein [Nocardia rosealba]